MSSHKTESTIREYLSRTLQVPRDVWKIDFSSISGRGLFATKDIQPGEVIFHDRPVAIGPRAKIAKPICVACYKTGSVETCPRGCRLPVCSATCSTSPQHAKECQYLKANLSLAEDDQWSLLLLQALTPLRCLILEEEDKTVIQCLQGLSQNHHSIEVAVLRKYLGSNLTLQDEQWVRKCSLALDCNAFETLSVHGEGDKQSSTSLRGLYPLAAIMNHECSPNTYHIYNKQCVMKVKASRLIQKGEEITTSYTSLLWNTTIRRTHLQNTKQFMCDCKRCKDSMEFGTFLSGLCCPKCKSGTILPESSLNLDSLWICNACSSQMSPKQVSALHVAQGMVLSGIDTTNPEMIVRFLDGNIPLCKQVIVQLKLGFIWDIGHSKDYPWEELPINLLDLKEKFCYELLQLMDMLRLGECRMKGLILFELHCIFSEKLKKKKIDENAKKFLEMELKNTLMNALEILNEDAAVPQELPLRLNDFERRHCL